MLIDDEHKQNSGTRVTKNQQKREETLFVHWEYATTVFENMGITLLLNFRNHCGRVQAYSLPLIQDLSSKHGIVDRFLNPSYSLGLVLCELCIF